ncbi:elongation factor Ts, partial [Chloroflexota bacterium]
VGKKAHRAANQGVVEAYIHPGERIGSLVELNCETDFVARTVAFRELSHDLALQITATNPVCISEADIPDGEEREPSDACLLLQPFIKEPRRTVQDIIAEATAKVGENIRVRRFARFELSEQETDEPDQI